MTRKERELVGLLVYAFVRKGDHDFGSVCDFKIDALQDAAEAAGIPVPEDLTEDGPQWPKGAKR